MIEKYDRLADGFSEREYADPVGYSARRAQLVVELGPRLRPGDSVLDLGCGDGIMAAPLVARGLRYTGLDASPKMLEAARRRHPELAFVAGRFEDYALPEPVDATVCLRSFYQPADRVAFFRHVAESTRVKFVFDFRPASHPAAPILRDLDAAGFSRVELRPFFLPQLRRLPGAAVPLVDVLERMGPLATLLSRRVGVVFCCATP